MSLDRHAHSSWLLPILISLRLRRDPVLARHGAEPLQVLNIRSYIEQTLSRPLVDVHDDCSERPSYASSAQIRLSSGEAQPLHVTSAAPSNMGQSWRSVQAVNAGRCLSPITQLMLISLSNVVRLSIEDRTLLVAIQQSDGTVASPESAARLGASPTMTAARPVIAKSCSGSSLLRP
jgi:hypothetical protein